MAADRVADFVQSAEEFCSFVESHPTTWSDDFRHSAARVLVSLYLRALELPQVESPSVDASEVRALRPPALPAFGGRDVYWMLFESNEPGEPVCGSLSDDFLDIYDDVKTGLLLWSAEARTEAIWHWRFNFDEHWGRHAVEAMRALHHAST